MTYLTFHLVFILPVIFVVFFLCRMEKIEKMPARFLGIATLAGIAFFYTTPWDNYLVASNIWEYGDGRILEQLIVGYVPFEEYLFFILQPLMTGGFFLLFAGRMGIDRGALNIPLTRGKAAIAGLMIFLGLTILGIFCIAPFGERFRYIGLILVWACPVLAFQWIYGGGLLWKFKKLLFMAAGFPTLYLWIVDSIAITWGIWTIVPQTSTGWMMFNLPVEEAVFFLVTNVMVVQGLLLFYQAIVRIQRHGKGLGALE